MSKFGRFSGDKLRIGSAGSETNIVSRSSGSLVDRARAAAPSSDLAEQIVSRQAARFAIALDATGSMAHLIGNAKKSIGEIIRRVTSEAGLPVELELFVYRDYDVRQLILERSGLSGEAHQLQSWLSRVQALGGGGNQGEAIEVALEAILAAQHFRCVILAGDEPANGVDHIQQHGGSGSTAHQLAQRLGSSNIPVHTFVVGQDPTTIADFKRLAATSGGQSGRLDGSREMIDMAVMAMLASLTGRAGVERYIHKTQLSSNAAAFGALLLDGPK